MPRRRKNSVFGPYPHRGGFIVEVRTADGERRHRRFDDEKEADDYAAEMRAHFLCIPTTVEGAIEAYQRHMIDKGNRKVSYTETTRRLKLFFSPHISIRLDLITPTKAKNLYLRLTDDYAVDTHRNILLQAKSFMRWAVREGWLGMSPVEGIQGIGARTQGKPQLRISEVRKFYRHAMRLARKGDTGAVAGLLVFLLSLRASEVIQRLVRDVDDDGRLLWVTRGKTRAARRTLEVPDPLRPILAKLAKGRPGEDLLFGEHWRDWPRKQIKRICRAAGVPEICAHGMRGTHSSIAREAGATGHLVAQAMGHESVRMHEVAYAKEESMEAGTRKRVLTVLDGGKSLRRGSRRNAG